MSDALPPPIAAATAAAQAAETARGADKAGAEARRAGEEFEAVYLSFMFSNMFTDLAADGPFSGGPGEELYRSQLYDELGRILARSGGVGIADAVVREIMRHQEV